MLNREELLMLYKHKERIAPNEQETRLLLSSWLKGIGPALYWLLNVEPPRLLEWLRAEESKEGIDRNEKVSIVLLRRRLGESPVADEDYLALRDYRLSAELAALILEDPLAVPDRLVANGLRHRREEVREACLEAITAKIKDGDWNWIRRLQASSSPSYRRAYQTIVLRGDIPIPITVGKEDRALGLFTSLKKIMSASVALDSLMLYESLLKKRPPQWIMLFGKGLMYVRSGKMRRLLGEAKRLPKNEAVVLLAAIGDEITSADFDNMVSCYENWNSTERGRYERNTSSVKASALSETIARLASPTHLPRLRSAIKNIRLTVSSRGIVLALLKCGAISDLKFIMGRIAADKDRIDYWNHAELGRVALKLTRQARTMPKFLRDIVEKDEFWQYVSSKERHLQQKGDLLPILSVDNRSLYIRLAAFAVIGAAKKGDLDLLLRLTGHNYGLIAGAAATSIVDLLGDDALRRLSETVDDSIRRGRSESLAQALRSAEMELFHIVSL